LEDHKISSDWKLLLATTLTVGVWAAIQVHQGVNTNIRWMTTEASRFLAGERMTDGYYNTNPPMSMLFYTAPAFLVRCFHIPVYYATFFYALFLTALSGAAVWRLVPLAVVAEEARLAFMTSFLLSCTLLPGHYFGDREVILMLGLIPLGLAQLAITRGFKLRWRLVGPVIVLGTLATLLKPQFLIVSGLLILHRCSVWKNLRAFVTVDCLIIAATILAYIGFIFLLLPDFVTTILPDVALLYVSFLRNNTFLPNAFLLGCIAIGMICLTLVLKPRQKGFVTALFAGCLVGLLSYVLQGKFSYYHLIPALMFFQCGTALLLAGSLRSKKALVAAFLFSLAFGMAGNRDWLSPLIYPSQYAVARGERLKIYHWPSHEDYRRSALVGLVETYAGDGSYFIFGSMPVVNIPAAYTNAKFGSRFPCFWFLPALIDAEEKLKAHLSSHLTASELISYKQKYAEMVAADFGKYSPDLVILARLTLTTSERSPFMFEKYFSFNPEFSRQWAHYKKLRTITINTRDYYGGYDYGVEDENLDYDVYIRR
jgi:hypothetical protein